jgi:hypothetical protein
VLFASKAPTVPDRHHLAVSRMIWIVDPRLERRTPGIMTLVRLASGRRTSRLLSATPPASLATPCSSGTSASIPIFDDGPPARAVIHLRKGASAEFLRCAMRASVMSGRGQPLTKSAANPLPMDTAGLPLYGADFVKGVPQGSYPFFRPSVSLFDLAAVSSSRPTTSGVAGARRNGEGWSRLSAAHPKGLGLDGSEHDGTLAVVGMTMPEEEPACGARRFVPHPCMRWVQRPEP